MYTQTFGDFTDPEDMDEFLSTMYHTSQQEEEIASENIRTLIVEAEDQIIGFAQVRSGLVPECVVGELPIELWRFYVDQLWQGRGIAQDLMNAAKAGAVGLGGRTIWLGVWEDNARAISFYSKSGFRDVGSKSFWVGKDRQTDRVMVSDLNV
jgi:ribosomal protein S18 acetylase RimI-like enzyme